MSIQALVNGIGSGVVQTAQGALDLITKTSAGYFAVEIVSSLHFANGIASRTDTKVKMLTNGTGFFFLLLAIQTCGGKASVTGEMLKTGLVHTAIKIMDASVMVWAFTEPITGESKIEDTSHQTALMVKFYTSKPLFSWRMLPGLVYFGLRAADLFAYQGQNLISLLRGHPGQLLSTLRSLRKSKINVN